ncbi:MAG: phosphoenolpyruvate carboxykinase (ATP), partial [bacterium]
IGSSHFDIDPIFGLDYVRTCASVPSELLNARKAWANEAAYDEQANKLARLFHDNFAKFSNVSQAIQNAGPRV